MSVSSKGSRSRMNDTRPVINCYRCDNAIPYLFHGDNETATNLDNGLVVLLSGGYGEFRDNLGFLGEDDSDIGGAFRAFYCHDCAHELCDWMGVNTDHWHSHLSAPAAGGATLEAPPEQAETTIKEDEVTKKPEHLVVLQVVVSMDEMDGSVEESAEIALDLTTEAIHKHWDKNAEVIVTGYRPTTKSIAQEMSGWDGYGYSEEALT